MTTDLETRIRTTLRARAETIGMDDLDSHDLLGVTPTQRRSSVLLVGVAAAIALLAGGLVLTTGRAGDDVATSSQPPSAAFVSTARYAPTALPTGWTVTSVEDIALSNSGADGAITQTWLGPVDDEGDTPIVIQVRSVAIADVDVPSSDELLPNIISTGTGDEARITAGWVDGAYFHAVVAEGVDETTTRTFTDRLQADSQRPGYVQLRAAASSEVADPFSVLDMQDDHVAAAPPLTWATTVTISGPDATGATLQAAPRDAKRLEIYAADGTMIAAERRASVVTGDNGALTLSWTNGTTVFTLTGDLPIETLTSMASSIEPVDDTAWATMQQTAAVDYLAAAGEPDLTGAVSNMTVSVFEAADRTTLCASFTDGTERCSSFNDGSDLRAGVAVHDRTAIIFGWTGTVFTASSGKLTVNGNRIDATDIDGQQIYAFPVPPHTTEITICHATLCGSLLGFG